MAGLRGRVRITKERIAGPLCRKGNCRTYFWYWAGNYVELSWARFLVRQQGQMFGHKLDGAKAKTDTFF